MSEIHDTQNHECLAIDRPYLLYSLQRVENILNYTGNVIDRRGSKSNSDSRERLNELRNVMGVVRKTCDSSSQDLNHDEILNFFVLLGYISCECFGMVRHDHYRKVREAESVA